MRVGKGAELAMSFAFPSIFRKQFIELRGFDELSRRANVGGQFGKVGFNAFDLCAFSVVYIIGKKMAPGFDDEIKSLAAVFARQQTPVRATGS